MRSQRLQFALKSLFGALTATALVVWWLGYGRPAYQVWHSRHRLVQAVRLGQAPEFVEALVEAEQVQCRRLRPTQGRKQSHPRPHGRINTSPERLEIGDPIVEECTNLLADASSDTRALAALALGCIRRDPTLDVDRLIKALDDPSTEVVAATAYSLSLFGDEAKPAVPKLLQLCKAGVSVPFEALLDIVPPFELAEALNLGGISWALAPPRQTASAIIDDVLRKIYRVFNLDAHLHEIDRWKQQSSADLAVATTATERQTCEAEIAELEMVHKELTAERSRLLEKR